MKNILLIEDNDNIRDNTSEILSLAGYKTFSASSGPQGILLATQVIPDLIICDIVMPDMDGFEVLKSIKNVVALSQIPFIFLTGKADITEQALGMSFGVDDYISKPFDAEELLDAVELNLQKGRTKNFKQVTR